MKNIFLIAALLVNTVIIAQVGIGTQNPQGIFNIDGAKDNATTGVPTTAQAVNDFIVTGTGNVGVGTISPASKLQVNGNALFAPRTTNDGIPTSGSPITVEIYGKLPTGTATQVGGIKMGWFSSFGGIEVLRGASVLGMGLGFNIASEATGTTSEAMRITSDGNVGIRNTNPSSPLVVQGVTGNGVLKLLAPSIAAGDNWWMGFGHGTTSTDANDRARIGVDVIGGGLGRLFFTTGAPGSQVRAMFIDENQRIGISTVAPTEKLDVNGTGLFRNGNDATVFLKNQLLFGYNTSANYRHAIKTRHNSTGLAGNAIDFYTWKQGTDAATTVGTQHVMTLDGNGNAGIGTTVPTTKLHVNSDLAATNTINANASMLRLSRPSTTSVKWDNIAQFNLGSYAVSNVNTNDANTRMDLALNDGAGTSTNNVMTWQGNGNVGIGTTAPAYPFHLKSGATTSLYIESTTPDNNGIIVLNANVASNWATQNIHEFIFFQKQGVNIGGISHNAGGSMVNYNTSSDYRLKKDLKDFNGLELIKNIKIYDYAWKSDNTRMYGVMAHELQNIIPYAVTGKKDEVDANGTTKTQSVDYSKLSPIVIKALQEQQAVIEKQQKEIDELKKLVNQILKK